MLAIFVPIIFQVVKLAEKTIKGKKRGKDKKYFAQALVETALETLYDLDVTEEIPHLEEVEAIIEMEVGNLKYLPSPTLIYAGIPKSQLELEQERERALSITVEELVQIISAASGRNYP